MNSPEPGLKLGKESKLTGPSGLILRCRSRLRPDLMYLCPP
jgi:hypothetical protein